MKVAIVGAGFSGLALTWYLLEQGAQVDLFDEKGIGAGASGVSAGLLHPYIGEKARRSWNADEAMAATKELLTISEKFIKSPVADFSGILRKVTPDQTETFNLHIARYKDVEKVDEDHVWIKSGATVHSQKYLEGLYGACSQRGVRLLLKKVDGIDELAGYDAYILALGAGVFTFPELENLTLSGIKGQTLICKWPFETLKRPLLGKGHIVPLQEKGLVHLGATYEKTKVDSEPCLEKAVELLTPKANVLAPYWEKIEPISCQAGIRVARPGHATPWIYRVSEKGWALTAMASRGLLYHASFAKLLVGSF